MIVSTCRLCGGDIGSHSDLCGNCGHDPYTLSEFLLTMSRREIMLLLLGLVGTGGGAGIQVEATKNYSYVVDAQGKPSGVRLDGTTYQVGYDLIHTKEVYKPRAGAKVEVTGVYINGADGNRVLLKDGELQR